MRKSFRSRIVGMSAAVVASVFCVLPGGVAEGRDDRLVNCNEVRLEDRCACNQRILRALTAIRSAIEDPELVSAAAAAPNLTAIQQERQHRLRTFYAPGNCAKNSTAKHLPTPERETTKRTLGRLVDDYHFRPVRSQHIKPIDGPISPDSLLVGRWEGWMTLFGSKPQPIALHVLAVEGNGHFVKACSDQGMVFGRVSLEGYLEVPRTDAVGRIFSIRLWMSPSPNDQDLEGVTLLEARPGETLMAGLAWLTRPVKLDWTTPPSSYFCQDRDLEEQRRIFRGKHKDD